MRPSLPLLLIAALPAQSVVVPNANATLSATGVLNNVVRESGAPRSYMMGINASELTAIPVGSLIMGISFRAGHTTSNPTLWPTSNVVWTPYEITVGNVIPTASWSLTFMANFTGTPVLARSGPMLMPPSVYPNVNAAPVANPWGEFYFDFQVPFLYLGGDLGFLFTHPGSNASTSIFFEQVNSNTAVHGNAMTNAGTGAFRATTATSMNYAFCVVRVHYGYGNAAGCPGTGGLTPNLVQNADTVGGGTLLMSAANAPANSAALYLLGVGRLAIPLPTCTLLTAPVVALPVTLDANGRYAMSLQVPTGVYGKLNAQVAVLDPGAPSGFTLSNGIEPTAR